jgi:hypothetical protein
MNIMKKRGQIPSQAFVYILALLIIVFILVFGYNSAIKAKTTQQEVELAEFEAKLRNDVSSLNLEYGSAKVREYKLPSGFDEICLVDIGKVDSNLLGNHPLIKDSVESGVKQNVFLSGRDRFKSFYIEGLQLSFPYFSCATPTESGVELQFESAGDKSIVTPPPNEGYCRRAEQDGLCYVLYLLEENYNYTKRCCTDYGLCCEG